MKKKQSKEWGLKLVWKLNEIKKRGMKLKHKINQEND
jgi:hypothetical protein